MDANRGSDQDYRFPAAVSELALYDWSPVTSFGSGRRFVGANGHCLKQTTEGRLAGNDARVASRVAIKQTDGDRRDGEWEREKERVKEREREKERGGRGRGRGRKIGSQKNRHIDRKTYIVTKIIFPYK